MDRLPPWLAPDWDVHARRLAEGRVPHALLAAGPAGLGKRALVEAVAASLLCIDRRADGHACGRCRACAWRLAGTHPDLVRVGIAEDATQITVDQIRALGERLALAPQPGGRQVAVIDPADEMNPNAANALLKTLEEPTPDSVLILVADQPARLLPTILSRCQRFAIRMPGRDEALAWLIGRGVAPARAAEALMLARGNPGEAARRVEPEAVRLAEDVRETFLDVVEGRRSAVEVAGDWARDRPGERLDWLAQATSLVAWPGGAEQPAGLERLAALIRGAESDTLAAWWDDLNRVRSLIRTPVRTDLLITANLAAARRAFGRRAIGR